MERIQSSDSGHEERGMSPVRGYEVGYSIRNKPDLLFPVLLWSYRNTRPETVLKASGESCSIYA